MTKMKWLLPLVLLSIITPPVAAQTAGGQNVASSGSPANKGQHYREQTGDLPNFHEVHPFLYRGGQPTTAGLKKLKEMGVGTIIDLRGNPEQVFDESKEASSLGMKYINLPMSSQPPTKNQVHTFLKQVESAARGKSKGPLFVHCAHGSDRTGCLVGIWRVTHDGFNYDQAYQEMCKYYFTPKFVKLSGAVKLYSTSKSKAPTVEAEAAPEKASQPAGP